MMGEMQSTNDEYGTTFLATRHFTFDKILSTPLKLDKLTGPLNETTTAFHSRVFPQSNLRYAPSEECGLELCEHASHRHHGRSRISLSLQSKHSLITAGHVMSGNVCKK